MFDRLKPYWGAEQSWNICKMPSLELLTSSFLKDTSIAPMVFFCWLNLISLLEREIIDRVLGIHAVSEGCHVLPHHRRFWTGISYHLDDHVALSSSLFLPEQLKLSYISIEYATIFWPVHTNTVHEQFPFAGAQVPADALQQSVQPIVLDWKLECCLIL